MIKNIVFDMGNVIIKWDPYYVVSQFSDHCEYYLKEVFQSHEWLAYDAGTMSRDEVINTIVLRIGEHHRSVVYNLVYYWYKHCPMIDGIDQVIYGLKEKGYRIYLLSNTNPHFDEYKDTLPLFEVFNGIYLSAIHRKTKPNAEIYYHFLDLYLLNASECLFIDDIDINIKGAISCGMTGYVFDGNVETLKQYLENTLEK